MAIIMVLLSEPKCPFKVSEPKWASLQTIILREGIYWYSGVTCT